MNLRTEFLEENQKILIISPEKFSFIEDLKKNLKKYGAEVFFAPELPKSLTGFDYCFIVNEKVSQKLLDEFTKTKIVLILINNPRDANRYKTIAKKIKVIEITGDRFNLNDIDKILWFSFAQSREHYLKFSVTSSPRIKTHIPISKKNIPFMPLSKKKIFLLLLSLIIFLHLAFIPPFLMATYFSYKSYIKLTNENISDAQVNLNLGTFYLEVAKKLYSIVRPSYLLFSLVIPVDTAFDIDGEINSAMGMSISEITDAKKIVDLLFKKNKSSEEKNLLVAAITSFHQEIISIKDSLTSINQKLPSQLDALKKIKDKLSDDVDAASKLERVIGFSDSLLAKGSEKKYLLLFANNMELRPGGGFMGSFGVINMKDYTVDDIKIYDVYDADGQLLIHIEPPEPIKKYLHIPHLFLRDSNFSPDFLQNYLKAQVFLDREMGMRNFSGAILLTTSAIQNLLSAFGDIYLPDFNETINDKNFYLKAQINSEKDFFPGSIQKKAFLGALAKQIILNLKDVSAKKLARALKKSLDEKQIVVFDDDQSIQNTFDSFYWSGRVIEPQCVSSQNCIIDYIFPYDANVGANKANFFVNRSLDLKTSIDKDGVIRHVLSVQYKNDATSEVFPGASYHDFFQVLLPKNSQILNVVKDGTAVEDFTETDDLQKTVGFYLEVPPKKTVEIKIDYQITSALPKGNTMYQLVFQKQIGAANTDLALEFNLDKSIYALSHNFSPLVKEDEIIYNTSLTTDKIFFIELVRQ